MACCRRFVQNLFRKSEGKESVPRKMNKEAWDYKYRTEFFYMIVTKLIRALINTCMFNESVKNAPYSSLYPLQNITKKQVSFNVSVYH